MRPVSTRPAHERSAALVLAPALLLVLLALAVIAVDLSALHSAHRSIHRIVATAADDAAGLVDGHHLQLTGAARIDQQAATRLITARLDRAALPGAIVGAPRVVFDDNVTLVTVEATVDVDHVVARAVPTHSSSSRLVVAASARMVP